MRHQSVINQWGFKNPITFYIMYKGVWKWILMCGFVQEWGGKHCAFYHRISEFCTNQLLHKHSFTPSTFSKSPLLHKLDFPQTTFYTSQLLHKRVFARTSFYANQLFDQPAFTQSTFCTNQLLQTSFYTNQLLHKPIFRQSTFDATTFYTNQLYTSPALGHSHPTGFCGMVFLDDWRTYLTGFHC